MVTKIIETNIDKIVVGINKAADIITSTMSAKGKNVIISDVYGNQKFTQDGVSVAKAIKLDDPIENIGAKLVISSCDKTVLECGDGTTLTAGLVKYMTQDLLEVIKTTNINEAITLLESEINDVLEQIKKRRIVNIGTLGLKSIAQTAGKSKEVGELFYNIFEEAGVNANIKVEKTNEVNGVVYDIKSGFEVRNGFMHSAFITDKDTEQCIYDNVFVKTFSKELTKVEGELENLLGEAKANNIPVIIFSPRFNDAVIRYCTMAKLNSGVKVVLVKSGGWGELIKRNIEDIETFADKDGYVKKVIVTPFNCTMFNDKHSKIKKRVAQLEKLSESAIEDMDKIDYKSRITNLLGTGVNIFVGGNTEEEKNELFDRIEDAVGATSSALKDGYVEGAGYSLISAIEGHVPKCFERVFTFPYSQILSNANLPMSYDRINIFTGNSVDSYYPLDVVDSYYTIERAFTNALATVKLLVNTNYTLFNVNEK